MTPPPLFVGTDSEYSLINISLDLKQYYESEYRSNCESDLICDIQAIGCLGPAIDP